MKNITERFNEYIDNYHTDNNINEAVELSFTNEEVIALANLLKHIDNDTINQVFETYGDNNEISDYNSAYQKIKEHAFVSYDRWED